MQQRWVSINPVAPASVPPRSTRKISYLSNEFIVGLVEDPPGTPLGVPEPPKWKTRAEFKDWLHGCDAAKGDEEDLEESAEDTSEDEEDWAIAAGGSTITRVDSATAVNDLANETKSRANSEEQMLLEFLSLSISP
ncbi:hypothetical protein LTR78_001940 [Recurvomyces mirabilis]|uniref:Uncharacterized protein n=1 Tax=Recurvomyces mirabilis TaxID=574656 RepID=A0AAE0WTG4_9PEZI|nr:hypothetical protein LTR78_001940 [Recurvomyces mirabilis]KAK5160398.1 hypothetical protein LTS14_001410 [Recurvomyces mirabilis]